MSPASTLWTATAAAKATGGVHHGAWSVSGISIDTRTLHPGDLFVALSGPSFDGHDFAAEALDNGASAIMVSRVPTALDADVPMLLVSDTLRALEDLGRAARARSSARIIGVTGSVGKTSVKEALKLVLGAQAPTTANDGSLNNHWGLPLSLARMPESARYGVFEMGMNHPGEIEPLSRMARPDVAVVTAVEAVHKAHFDSVEGIADAKAEIFTGVVDGGIAVLNRDNHQFDRLARATKESGVGRIIDFGRHEDAVVRLIGADTTATGSVVRALVDGDEQDYRLNVPGDHWVINSLCVLAAVVAVDGDISLAAQSLAEVIAPKGRGRRSDIDLRDGGTFGLIDDSYNASPVSMAASFAVLGGARIGPGGRRIAVLGDMLELGDESALLHAALLQPLRRNGIDLVFTAGPAMSHLFDALPADMRGGHADDSKALTPQVTAAVRAGDVVTVKGSAGSRMGVVVQALHALDVNQGGAPGAGSGD